MDNTPEQAIPNPPRWTFIARLQDMVTSLMNQKRMKKATEDAQPYHRSRLQHENPQGWDQDNERRRQADARRERADSGSKDIEYAQAEVAYARKAQEVLDLLDMIYAGQRSKPEGSDYLISTLQRNSDAVRRFMTESQSPAAAQVIQELVTKGVDMHGSPTQLIREAQRISYEASKIPGATDAMREILRALSDRAQSLLIDEFETEIKRARREGKQGPGNVRELLERESGIVMTPDERTRLETRQADDNVTWNTWKQTIDQMIMNPRAENPARAEWVSDQKTPPGTRVVAQSTPEIESIWRDVERRSSTGQEQLSTSDLIRIDRQLREAESRYLPKDIPAGSTDYQNAVAAVHAGTEDKLNELARQLKARLGTEMPKIKEGIINESEFIAEMIQNKSRLGALFKMNPEMYKLFIGTGDRSGRFRNRVFLSIHSPVITDQRNSSHDNFGLYERADFTTFLDTLRSGLSNIKVTETGESMGIAWADYFNNLSNAIRQARDIDFWASQPAASVENFNKSLGMFQNEYTYHAVSLPAVAAAFRAYESTLRSIQTSNDGYIPPGLIEYNFANKGSFWDQKAKDILQQMISSGAVPELARDKNTYFHQVAPDGHSLIYEAGRSMDISDRDPDELNAELSMYMVLAKGFGMASARYLEIFANSKVPGSAQPRKGVAGFHSNAYEGLARSLNYMGTFIHKWQMGGYKYFYLMNMLIPKEKRFRITPEDSSEGMKAYLAFLDGTFEEKYGPEAKRFWDVLNFSRASSAIGKETLWRQYDSTFTWSDRERERLGGATRLALAGKYAYEAMKDFLVINKYREKYRNYLIDQNQNHGGNYSTSGAGFDALWQQDGADIYNAQITHEWNQLQDTYPFTGKHPHSKLGHDFHHLESAYTNALKARIWVEMAMRNPLSVAHTINIDSDREGPGGKRQKVKLHSLLVKEILGISPEELKFTETRGKATYGATPDLRQKRLMADVLELEGDLQAVKEIAIREGRDLEEADFRRFIKNEGRQDRAIRYWNRIKEYIIGQNNTAEGIYNGLGLGYAQNGEYYEWNLHKIEKAYQDEKLAHEIGGVHGEPVIHLTEGLRSAVGMDMDWIYSTDDMDFGRMDWLNLGARHWLRRGGDINAHWNGGMGVVDYFTNGLLPNPDKHKLAEALNKVRNAYAEDMMDVGYNVAANLAYMTDRLYSFDWARLGSPAQLDIWGTRRNVAAWTANGRREFWDALEHADTLPPHAHFYMYNSAFSPNDIHTLRKICHADNVDVWREIVTLGILLAVAITLYRAITAPSEDEEGGGGGHH